jgi:hypothetical protein
MNSPTASLESSPGLLRIKSLGVFFKLAFLLFALVYALAAAVSLGALLFAAAQGSHWSNPGEAWQIIPAAGTDIVTATFAWQCYKLFNFYSHGDFFTERVIHSIRTIGILFFIVAFSQRIAESILPRIPLSPSLQTAGLFFDALAICFCGFLILFIAWVMDEGRKLHQEQSLTI